MPHLKKKKSKVATRKTSITSFLNLSNLNKKISFPIISSPRESQNASKKIDMNTNLKTSMMNNTGL